jgi:hypothetical protein
MSSSYLSAPTNLSFFQVNIVIAVQYRCYRFVRLGHLVLDLFPSQPVRLQLPVSYGQN